MAITSTEYISLDFYNPSIYSVNAKYGDAESRYINITCTELSDVKWFMEQLFTGDDDFRGFVTDKEHRKKVEELLNAYYKKRITISWT